MTVTQYSATFLWKTWLCWRNLCYWWKVFKTVASSSMWLDCEMTSTRKFGALKSLLYLRQIQQKMKRYR